MQNLERQKFEESWKSAFDGAEMTPSDGVWNGLEVRLASDESTVMKKRVVFYQRLAAGLTVFALLSGGYAFFKSQDASSNPTQQVASTSPVVKEKDQTVNSDNATSPLASTEQKDADEQSSASASDSPSVNPQNNLAQSTDANVKAKATRNQRNNNDKGSNPSPVQVGESNQLIAIAPSEEKRQDIITTQPDQQLQVAEVVVPQAKLNQQDSSSIADNAFVSPLLSAEQINAMAEEQHAKEKKETKNAERMWLGMGAAAGSFNPGSTIGSGSSADMMQLEAANDPRTSVAAFSQAPQSTQKKMGAAYSVGMSVGKRFGKRWVLQGGLNLMRQQLEYTSNFTGITAGNAQKSSLADYASNYSTLSITTPYTVNSAVEMVSIPVQAGYMIIDRRVGWQVNAGVAQDFFVRNTLVDRSGNSEKFSQGAGDESPYHSLNWAGLLSSELSYRIGDHYRVSVVPGMRYSVRPMLKNPGNAGTPLIMDVGFRFKYLFK